MSQPSAELGNETDPCTGVCFCQGDCKADRITVFQIAKIKQVEQRWVNS